jgi:hypothetical protein
VSADPDTSGPVAAEPAPAAASDRPELLVAAAFAGAFLLARILKKIAE